MIRYSIRLNGGKMFGELDKQEICTIANVYGEKVNMLDQKRKFKISRNGIIPTRFWVA